MRYLPRKGSAAHYGMSGPKDSSDVLQNIRSEFCVLSNFMYILNISYDYLYLIFICVNGPGGYLPLYLFLVL